MTCTALQTGETRAEKSLVASLASFGSSRLTSSVLGLGFFAAWQLEQPKKQILEGRILQLHRARDAAFVGSVACSCVNFERARGGSRRTAATLVGLNKCTCVLHRDSSLLDSTNLMHLRCYKIFECISFIANMQTHTHIHQATYMHA